MSHDMNELTPETITAGFEAATEIAMTCLRARLHRDDWSIGAGLRMDGDVTICAVWDGSRDRRLAVVLRGRSFKIIAERVAYC